MEKPEIIVGLDIGTAKIAAIVGVKNQYGKIEILGSGKTESLGVNRGVISNIERTVESIDFALRQAANTANINVNQVFAGIAGQHIKSLQHKGSLVRRDIDSIITQEDIDLLIDDMHKLVMLPGEKIVHIIPQDFIVDNESGIRDPKGMSGIKIEANFHIITGLVTAANNINRCVNSAGVEVKDLILEPLASAEAVLSKEEKEAGVALVDIGGGTTDIAIFQDGIIRHTAVIPLGGNIITEDIKEGCTIIRSQAEALKIKHGSALASMNSDDVRISIPDLRNERKKEITQKNLSKIIQARLEEIISQVYWEIKNSGFEKKLIGGIVLTGGGALLKHIRQFTEYQTGLDTRIGFPSEHLAGNMPDELSTPIYATGIGLVIKGFEILEEEMKAKEHIAKPKQGRRPSFFDNIRGDIKLFKSDNIK